MRERRVRRPRQVVDLVVSHARQRFPGGYLHLQQQLHLPARLVQHVGHPVALLGDRQQTVPQALEVQAVQRTLVEVHQLPRGERAVHHVLAVVTGVVPAAADVERVVADTGLAGHRVVTLVRRDADVPGGPRIGVTDVLRVDRDTAAVVVEVRQRVPAQAVVGLGGDVERVADLLPRRDRVTASNLAERREVGDVHVVARHRVIALDLRFPAGDDPAGRVTQLPRQRRGGCVDDGRALGTRRRVGVLVRAHRRAVVPATARRDGAAGQRHVVEAQRVGLHRTTGLDRDLPGTGGHCGRSGELEGLGSAGERGGLVHRRRVRRGRELDRRADRDVLRGRGGEPERVGLPGLQRHVVLADHRLPGVHGAGRDVGTELARLHSRRCVPAAPPRSLHAVERAVEHAFVAGGGGRGRRDTGDEQER